MRRFWKTTVVVCCVNLAMLCGRLSADETITPAEAETKAEVKRNADADVQICELNLQSGATRTLFQIHDVARIDSLDVSSDGTRIAFSGVLPTDDGTASAARIFTCRMDGSEQMNVAAGYRPSWSPRRQRLTFSRSGGQGVWMMRADGSDVQLIDKLGRGASWSPDGSRICYILDLAGGSTDLAAFNIVEDEYVSLLGASRQDFGRIHDALVWSLDSTTLGFAATSHDDQTILGCVTIQGKPNAVQLVAVQQNIGENSLRLMAVTAESWFVAANIRSLQPSHSSGVFQLYAVGRNAVRNSAAPSVVPQTGATQITTTIKPLPGQLANRSNVAACLNRSGQTLIYVSQSAGTAETPR